MSIQEQEQTREKYYSEAMRYMDNAETVVINDEHIKAY